MYPHRVIEGKVYRERKLEAADTRTSELARLMAEPPTPHSVARRHREELEVRP